MAIKQSDLEPYLDRLEKCELYRLSKDIFCDQLDLTRIGYTNADLILVLENTNSLCFELPKQVLYYCPTEMYRHIISKHGYDYSIEDQELDKKTLVIMDYLLYDDITALRLYIGSLNVLKQYYALKIVNHNCAKEEYAVLLKKYTKMHKDIFFPPISTNVDGDGKKLPEPYVVPYRIKDGIMTLYILPKYTDVQLRLKIPSQFHFAKYFHDLGWCTMTQKCLSICPHPHFQNTLIFQCALK